MEAFVAVAAGQVDQAREVLNGRERDWRSAVAPLRHMAAGFCAPLVAALGDHDQISPCTTNSSTTAGPGSSTSPTRTSGPPTTISGCSRGPWDGPTRPKNGSAPRWRATTRRRAPLPRRRARRAGRAGRRTNDEQRCRDLLGMAEPEARQMGLQPLLARCSQPAQLTSVDLRADGQRRPARSSPSSRSTGPETRPAGRSRTRARFMNSFATTPTSARPSRHLALGFIDTMRHYAAPKPTSTSKASPTTRRPTSHPNRARSRRRHPPHASPCEAVLRRALDSRTRRSAVRSFEVGVDRARVRDR